MKDKVILITAAGARTGNAIARHLLERGFSAILCYRKNRSGVENLLHEYPDTPAFSADLTSEEEVMRLAEAIRGITPKLYGLINVVGDYLEKPVVQTSFDEYRYIMENNLGSVFLTCKHLYPLLKAQGNARVINFGYSHADRIQASRAPIYQIAKHGVIGLTRSLASEWGPDQISVNCISPGTLSNSIVKDSENPEDYIPQGRFGEYPDINHAIDMLLDEGATYLSGSNLIVSGGYNL